LQKLKSVKKAIIFLFLIMIGCKSEVSEDDLIHLNGRWEIQEVRLVDGSIKTYKVNEVIDEFSINGLEGYRRKVTPKFDGRYLAHVDHERILIEKADGAFQLAYATPYTKWKEKIIELSSSTLVLENQDKLQYVYKRHEPFSLKDGKTDK
jgi:hypothetical protein